MTVAAFTALCFAGSALAGAVGALSGLGGGVVIVPLLTLLLGVDMRYAMGASLIAVIATSSGAAAGYVRSGYSNIRIGMFLEIATTTGALVGAWLTARVHPGITAIIFGGVLVLSAALSFRKKREEVTAAPPDPIAARLHLDGSYLAREGRVGYAVRRVPLGFALMFVAGCVSGLLGIGSGALKVLAMDEGMRLPFRVSAATSNFMIGVTAAASAGVYLSHGFIEPGLAMPVMLGVLLGSLVAARSFASIPKRGLRVGFGVLILLLGGQMIYRGIAQVLHG